VGGAASTQPEGRGAMAAVAGPLCTWLVAACLSAACDAEEHKQKHFCAGGSRAGGGVMLGQRRRLGARRRGLARSGETRYTQHLVVSCPLFALLDPCMPICANPSVLSQHR
jgi:hypothetical protein